MVKKTIVQQAIYYLLRANPFVGNLLQEIDIKEDDRISTACLRYDKDDLRFEVLVNTKYLASLELPQRVALFFHEILHFTHGHIFRFENIGSEKEQLLKNIAADMSINQFIPHCHPTWVNHKKWKLKDGTPFPDLQQFETYYDLLKQTTNHPDSGNGDENDPASAQQNGEANAKNEVGPQSNFNKLKKYQPFDEHDWEQLTDAEKQQMLQEAKKAVTRAMDKAFKDHSTIPDSVKDLLNKIDAQIKKLNCKALLRYAIKKTLTTQNRTHTWYRPNKRYGNYAPGTTYDKAPFINVYIDCSGSISHKELNEFKNVMDQFLRAGHKSCNLGLWHTELFNFRKYKLNQEITQTESGGTDPACVLEHIEKTKPNLSIILTDGEYSRTKINLTQRIIWIISKDGRVDHPYKDYGMTIKMEGIL